MGDEEEKGEQEEEENRGKGKGRIKRVRKDTEGGGHWIKEVKQKN